MTADRMAAEAWTVARILAWRHAHDGDLQALVDDRRSITWREIDDASRALAGRLVAAGVGKGDRVGLLLPNSVAWATLAFATARIGAVLVPLSTLLRPPELLAQLRTASVAHLITARGFRGRAYLDELDSAAPGIIANVGAGRRHAALPSLRSVWTDDALPEESVAAEMVAALEERVSAADDMVILFTSGSRGAPKGVIHTHGSLLRAVASGLDARCVRRGERLYIPMPFFWTGGFCGGLLTVLLAGATLLTESEPEPARTLRFLARERATLFRGWPDQAARLATHPDFATTDLGTLGPASLAAVLPPRLRPHDPRARANLFGMTESGGPYCADRLDTDMPAAKHGSCGRPFPDMDVRIVDPVTGEAVPAGDEGEIRLRGPAMLRGICGRTRDQVFDRDGFYRTGDMGRLDPDGYLWFAGRLDDMVKIRGATVYPSEVEAALRTIPGVRQAFATDVARDADACEIGALVVADAEPHAIADAARACLSAFKVPTLWLVTGDPALVPLSGTGKIVKNSLQELLRTRGTRAPRRQEDPRP